MERRAFLTLLASAPIAALTPWPKLLPTARLTDQKTGIAIRYVKEWEIVASTRYVRPAIESLVAERERHMARALYGITEG